MLVLFRPRSAGGDIVISGNVDALVIAEQQATVAQAININASAEALVLAEQQATVAQAINVNAAADALVLTEHQATVSLTTDINIAAAADALVIAEQQATVAQAININASFDALVITEYGAAIALTSAAVAAVSAGGEEPGRRRGKYPRRVYIDGRLVTVRNAEEERELLRQWLESLQQTIVESEKPAEVVEARRAAIRVAKRIAKVDTRADAWAAQLRQYDEELVILLH